MTVAQIFSCTYLLTDRPWKMLKKKKHKCKYKIFTYLIVFEIECLDCDVCFWKQSDGLNYKQNVFLFIWIMEIVGYFFFFFLIINNEKMSVFIFKCDLFGNLKFKVTLGKFSVVKDYLVLGKKNCEKSDSNL